MAGTLYVVGTPIGNLGDMSPRAVQTLAEVDFIAAEDTRVTLKLLNHFEIKKELISYYEHNKNEKGGVIISRLLHGENCALVSDAGMPAISDPGEDLVRLAHESAIAVESVPGPSALVTALAIAGMPCGRFCFEGFLSVNRLSRKEHLHQIAHEKRTLVFYEAPHKLRTTLEDLYNTLGDRQLALVREITKLHETVFKTSLLGAITYYKENSPKGEYVLIIEGASEQEEQRIYTVEEAVKIARSLMDEGTAASAAAKEAALATGIKKGEIYKALVT